MNTKFLPLSAVGIAAAIALSGCGTTPGTGSAGHGTASHGGAGQATESAQGPAGSGVASGEHNAADAAFAQMMTPHHAQAVEMSDLLLAKKDIPAPVVELATRIKAEQAPEIEQMTGWLRSWGQTAAMSPGTGAGGMDHSMSGHGMAGMMSQQDMQALRDAQGTEAARLFLEQMIAHHEGAIVMAKEYTPAGRNAEALELSKAVVTTQEKEIGEMRDLIAGL